MISQDDGTISKRFFTSNSNSIEIMLYFSFIWLVFIHVATSIPDEQKVVAVI